jgi:GNAT superfamily N-acetyltransferase
MSVTIELGAPGDAPALAELAARTFVETFAVDNRAEDIELHLAQTYGTAQQRAELLDPNITTLLARVDGQLSGYAQLRLGTAPDCVRGQAPVELWRFYLARAWHGHGIAQVLMQHVEQRAQQRGAQTLWLGVWERNERAKSFYRKHGFVDVGSHVFTVGTDPQIDRILVHRLPRLAAEH